MGAPPLMKNLWEWPKASWTGVKIFLTINPSPAAFSTGALRTKNMNILYLNSDWALAFAARALKKSSHMRGAAGKIVTGLSARAFIMSGPLREFCRTIMLPVTNGARKVASRA